MIGALAFVLALAPAPALANKEAIAASVQKVLESPDYQFCHDGLYPLRPSETPWCPIVGDKSPSCPLLPDSCKAGTTEAEPNFHGKLGRSHKPGQMVEEDEAPPREIRLPNLGGLGKLLLWAMVLAGVIALGYVIAKSAMNRKKDEDEPPAEEPPEIGETPEAAARRAIETDVDRLLARARAHGAAGRYDAGIDDAWAALLRRLEGGELIRVHPSRTNGDYVRELAKWPELKSRVRAIARDVEKVQFGTEPSTEEAFLGVMSRVVPIATRAVGVAMFLLASSLIFACGPATQLGSHSHGAWDTSPSGTRAVFEVLRQNGLEPHWRVKPLAKLGDATPFRLEKGLDGLSGPDVLVLLPGTSVTDSDWAAVKAYAGRGGTILTTGDLPNLAELGIKPREQNANTALHVAPAVDAEFGDLRVATPGTRVLAVDVGQPDPILQRGADLYAAEVTVPGGVVIALGDGYLLTNAALTTGDNAAFLVTLLARHGKKIEFTGDFTGSSPNNPIEAIERGKLAWLLLQLMLFLGVFFLFAGVAFGKLRDPKSDSRRRFVEHARALGVQYARAGASRFAAAAYASYAIDRLRERIQLGTRRGLAPLAEAIATRTGRPPGEVMRILVEAQSAREAALDRDTPQDDLSLIRELSRLLKSTGGSR